MLQHRTLMIKTIMSLTGASIEMIYAPMIKVHLTKIRLYSTSP